MNKKEVNITSIEELEKLRKKICLKKLLIFCLLIIIYLIIVPNNDDKLIIEKIAISIAIIGPCYIFSNLFFVSKNIRYYKNNFKKIITSKVFNEIFDDVKFDFENGFSQEVIYETEMLRTGDRFISNDYISASYKNIHFETSDVLIQDEHTDSDGHDYYSTIFKGQWYIFDFNKPFKSNFQVCEKGFDGILKGNIFFPNHLQSVEMEDMEFNKDFDVYSSNDLDAFYVLTPKTIENIKTIHKKIKGYLLFCFINNKLHIGVYNNRDSYEPKIYKKVDYENAKKDILKELNDITSFIDELQLEKDLFRKEV